jgi:chromosome segregation ATPase
MGWIKDSVSWAHFVTVIRETVDELKKSIGQHSKELDQVRGQNQLLLQQSVQQANEIQRLERKIESIEAYLRGMPTRALTIDAISSSPRLTSSEVKSAEP